MHYVKEVNTKRNYYINSKFLIRTYADKTFKCKNYRSGVSLELAEIICVLINLNAETPVCKNHNEK